MSRDTAEAVLRNTQPGTFLLRSRVRDSSRSCDPGYALSLKYNTFISLFSKFDAYQLITLQDRRRDQTHESSAELRQPLRRPLFPIFPLGSLLVPFGSRTRPPLREQQSTRGLPGVI